MIAFFKYCSYLLAAVRLVPLSEYIVCGLPRLEMNRLNDAINDSADKSFTISMWIALVSKQMIRQT